MNANPARRFVVFLLIALLLTACGSTSTGATEPPAAPISPTNTSAPTLIPSTDTPAAPTVTPEPRLPADPQRVEFEAEDGTKLVGYYYPASVEPAPALILMHWAGGSNCDWVAVNLVQWAQNRGLPEGVAANPACANAQLHTPDSLADFPPLPEGQSYAIFAFDYRGHGESAGSSNWDPSGYLQDSIAAMKIAQGLDGVDPARVAAIGASIGADGAIDACGEGCLGALSLSPGNYLGKKYASMVSTLGADNKPAWCVASQRDAEAFPTCESASGENYQKFIYETQGHGMALFEDIYDPKITQVIFDFLQLAFGN